MRFINVLLTYLLSIGTDLDYLDYLERRNSPYFAFLCRMRLLYWPITSQWLKMDLSVNIVSQFHSSTFGHN